MDDYTRARKLEYCGADMRALAERLTGAGFRKDNVYLLHDRATETKYRPMKRNIEDHLRVILGLVERDDLVIVGFSGHGVHFGGKSYLCPSEAKLDDPGTLIALDDVYERLQKCRASLKVFLVDACRNDPRPGERSMGPTEETRRFANTFERPPHGILTLTSCAPGEIAREEEEFGHGVFMYYVLEGLGGRADVNRNGWVSMMEMYLYANDKTKAYVAKKFVDSQRPALKGDIHDDFDLLRVRKPLEQIITNSIGMKLVLIPAGEFLMGSGESAEAVAKAFEKDEVKAEQFEDEHPRHRVRITSPFYLGMYEVTVGQFRRLISDTSYKTEAEKDGEGGFGYDGKTGKFEKDAKYTWRNMGFHQDDDHPVVNITWNDAVEFCKWLSRKESKSYRLPTEAEWEYACRAGTNTRYCSGDDPEGLVRVGNVADGTAKARFSGWTTISARDGYVFTAPVGRFQPNAFGLYDVHGNVWEWCRDWYDGDYYANSPVDDPAGPASGSARLRRGGGWRFAPGYSRSANRYGLTPSYRISYLGFRLALVPLDASSR